MIRKYELDEEDIRRIIAESIGAQLVDVVIDVTETTVGYHEEKKQVVTATVEIKS